MNRARRREEADAALRSEPCGESVNAKNWEQHHRTQHPGIAIPSVNERLESAIAEREQSRANVGTAPDRGMPGDGDTGQAAEQEPIPNPADRRPSTLDSTVGY